MKRELVPGRWTSYGRARPAPDRVCCDGRCNQGWTCPTFAPAPAPRRGWRLAAAALTLALLATGTLLCCAPAPAFGSRAALQATP